MASRAPSTRDSSLPKSWEEMNDIQNRPGSGVPGKASATATQAPVESAHNNAPNSPSARSGSHALPAGTPRDRQLKNARRSFWREHKNLVLLATVIICPTLAMLSLLLMADTLHPFEGRTYEGRTVSQWVSLLGDDDPLLRSKAFDTLVSVGEEVTPQLARALRDTDVQRRRDAAMVFQKIRPKDKRATEALAGALTDQDLWVRWRSAQALRAMGTNARDAVTPLAVALTDDDPRVRCAAAQALGRIGKDAVIAHSALLSAMQDERTYVRRAASVAMESIMAEAIEGEDLMINAE